jgi:hypothetical protein
VIHGLGHDFSGRISALYGLTYLLEDPGTDVPALVLLLNQEIELMEETLRLLRHLPDDSSETELLAPGEIIPDLALLVRVQRGLENVELRMEGLGQAPAVRMDRTLFSRALLLLLTAAGEEAHLRGKTQALISAGEDAGGMRLAVGPLSTSVVVDPERAASLPRRLLPRERYASLLQLLVGEGVRMEEVEVDGMESLQLSFPSP